MKFQEKLVSLRKLMQQDNIDAVRIGTTDPHQSESVAAHWKAVQWFTDFTGSVGICVVTAKDAAFWTDSRYTSQAERELQGKPMELFTVAIPGVPTWQEWLMDHVEKGATLALDGEVLSLADYRSSSELLALKDIKVSYTKNYVGMIWDDRPAIPKDPIFEHDVVYAGQNRQQKIEAVRAKMAEKGVDTYLACSLDDIAWVTNLRGHDNPLYPFFHGYLLFTKERMTLCTDLNKFSPELANKVKADGFTLRPSNDIFNLVKELDANSMIYIDPFKTPLLLRKSFPSSVHVVEGMDFLAYMKSRKNDVEQENVRISNIKESVALCRYIMFIKNTVDKREITEYELGQAVETFRRMDPLYLQPGNLPIIASGKNAALPHYRPSITNTCKVAPEGFVLFDLCAQYYTGTTDITRTVQVGPLSEEMRKDYTLTLKSLIALSTQIFPFGITGPVLDGVSKAIQWNNYMHYGHGTGHGIGFLLNVHEGPCKIITEYSVMFPYGMTEPLNTGMLFSNEPGVYKPGRHGVRLENAILVQEAVTNEFARFLKFETVTFCPFERDAIVVSMLNSQELKWLNNYHAMTYEKLSPYLNEEECKWLKERTQKL
ncbi:MAG: M24 family metallopeptidase [Dehalobacterium sp.]